MSSSTNLAVGAKLKGTTPALRDCASHCLIVAYRESTESLETALISEGFTVETLRPNYTPLEMTYSRTIRCMLNHANAWEKARKRTGLTIVIEADFVPCVGFGEIPMPFDPAVHGDDAWAYLYSGGPRFFEVLPDRTLRGHSSTTVAYLLSPRVAALCAEYGREELIRHGDLTQYSLWDTQFQWHVMGKGGKCFMAYRQFGEHGGMPNKEHRGAPTGILLKLPFASKLGIGLNHHADTL